MENPSPSMAPAGSHRPDGGPGTDRVLSAIRHVSSSMARKSSPLGTPLENAPGTFSQHIYLGRTWSADPPRCSSAVLISFITRICSINRPERSPARPALFPAKLKSWHGDPPVTMSTGGSFAPFRRVISPTWSISGNLCLVT